MKLPATRLLASRPLPTSMLLLVGAFLVPAFSAAQGTRLLQQPDVSGDLIAFAEALRLLPREGVTRAEEPAPPVKWRRPAR